MDLEQIKTTEVWALYEKGRNYHRMMGYYTDADRNYNFYNGDQWAHAKLGGVEPVQKNFIKPIVKYKVGVTHDNLYAIHYSSQNFENKEFRKEAEKVCEMLNKKAARIWEKDKMDLKGRRVTKDAAINDEGIIYVDYDDELQMPVNEIVKKVDVYYGNENDDDIQKQPYILIRNRVPVLTAREIARREGLSEEKIRMIIGDNDNFEESGEAAKYELDNMVTLITKMWKENGTVRFTKSTRWVDIKKNKNSGLTLYNVAHMLWEEKEGSARGEGEVRYLIPNQIEVNRTEMRRVLSVKSQAYPKRIVNESKVTNLSAIDKTGITIKVKDAGADDVSKIVNTLAPAQMSPDVKQLQDDLINVTRDLAGAGDAATGNVDPEAASGRAILAVQQASQSPMTEQKEAYKNFVEDLARIWLDMLITYNPQGAKLEEEITDPESGEKITTVRTVAQETLKALRAEVKVDITPRSAFDRYAQELSLENLLQAGFFNIQRLQELKTYISILPDDANMPKQKVEEAIRIMEEEQRKIIEIDAHTQMMQQRMNQFLSEGPDMQARQILDAEKKLQQKQLG